MTKVLVASKVICLDRAETLGTWVLIQGGVVAAVGTGDPPPAGETFKTEGVVLPGMIDSHVHLTTTGLYRSGLDLKECRSVGDLLRTVGAVAGRGWVIAGNFDPGRNPDARMPTRGELDGVSAGMALLVSRADGHSCALNSAAWEALGIDLSLPGIDLDSEGSPTGILSNLANYQARERFFASLPEEAVARAQRSACAAALERGVTSVHEMAAGTERDLRVLVENRGSYPIHVRPYFATLDVGKVIAAGLDCIGGDLFLDGSIGSHTAAMSRPYLDAGTSGTLYHSDEEVTQFFAEATRAGLQAGVHAIGDAAIEQALRSLEAVFLRLGPEGALGARRLRHRIEHFECVSADQVRRAGRLGVVASVQPAFDRYWGGPGGMYASRLGERAHEMNPFAEILKSGMILAGGSDSTVTPLDPFLGIASAAGHSRKEFGVSIPNALRMFSAWAAAAGRDEAERGTIEPGKRADFCVVDEDPRRLEPEQVTDIAVLETWVGGSRVYRSS